MPPTDDLLQNLCAEIAQGRVLAIIGAGVSIGATKGHPQSSWTGLLESGIERCLTVAHPLPLGWSERLHENIHSGDPQLLLATAQEISLQLGAPEGGEYRRWLRETVGSLPLHDRIVLDALRDLPVILATTNYDSLLEEVTGLAPVTWRDRTNAERVLRGEDRGIVHLHGFWNEPESVILSLRSYEEISRNEHVQSMLRALRFLRTFLFVGCGDGLADPNFGAFLRWSRKIFRTSEARHFRLRLDCEVAKVQAHHPPEERIFALPYGPDHTSLGPFLRSLAPEPSESLDLPPRALIVRHLHDLDSRIVHDQQKTSSASGRPRSSERSSDLCQGPGPLYRANPSGPPGDRRPLSRR